MMNKILNPISHFFSAVFIPLLLPAYLYIIIFIYFPQLTPYATIGGKLVTTIAVFLASSVPPLVLIQVLYQRKVISSLMLAKRSDRVIPQIFGCVNYILICIFLTYRLGLGNALTLCMVSGAISLCLITIITSVWKISTHAAGVWGMLGILIFLNTRYPTPAFLPVYVIIAISTVATCLARLQLRAHTLMQVVAGSFLGFCCGYFTFYWLFNK